MLALDLVLPGAMKNDLEPGHLRPHTFLPLLEEPGLLRLCQRRMLGKGKSSAEDSFGNLLRMGGRLNRVLAAEVPATSPEVAVPSEKLEVWGLVRPGFEFCSNSLTQSPHLQNGDHNFPPSSFGRWVS